MPDNPGDADANLRKEQIGKLDSGYSQSKFWMALLFMAYFGHYQLFCCFCYLCENKK